MRRLAPVTLELAVVAAVLLAGGLAPALIAAQDGAGGLVVASILLLAGGIYFAVVARLRRGETAAVLAQVGPADPGDPREPAARSAARAALDGLSGVALAALTVLVDLAAIGIALVLGLGAYRLWQRAQVRRWEREMGRELLREPSIARPWLAPEHLRWVERDALDSGLTVVDAPERRDVRR